MKVSDYVPNLYKNNIEMNNIIYSEEEELETRLKPYIDNAFKDTFPKTATINGIKNYEEMLGIILDSNGSNIEYRRNKILSILSTLPPLSYRWLENSLIDLVGKNNFTLEVNANEYSVVIGIANIFNDTASIVYDFYRPLIPANMTLDVNLFEETYAELYSGAISHEGEKIQMEGE